ncbi:MAG: hypothetical protein JJE02_09880, partial [Propionibacteriales bacterium]|nr:hypothetical protein [Propionibacteriales bacterium]
VLQHQPYRIADSVAYSIALPLNVNDLLPTSSAPIVAAVRAVEVRG